MATSMPLQLKAIWAAGRGIEAQACTSRAIGIKHELSMDVTGF